MRRRSFLCTEVAAMVRREDSAGLESVAWPERDSDYRVAEDRLGRICVGDKAGWDELSGTLG